MNQGSLKIVATMVALLFISAAGETVKAQPSIIFDIDSATTSGGDVVQSVTVGGSVFELTASHSSSAGANLFNVTQGNFTRDPGDDLVFFSSDTSLGTDDSFWTVSVTQDSNPINFNLTGLDFATFGDGHTFDLINDRGEVITDNFSTGLNGSSGSFSLDNTAGTLGVQSFNIVSGSGFQATQQIDFNNIGIQVAAVPEPSGLALTGLASLLAFCRRRR